RCDLYLTSTTPPSPLIHTLSLHDALPISLTHSWPRPIVRKCEREYARSRWPDGVPDDFLENLEAARMYMNFRWLGDPGLMTQRLDRKSTRLNSSHDQISYAVFCLKKKNDE